MQFDAKPYLAIQNPVSSTATRFLPLLVSQPIGIAPNGAGVGFRVIVPTGMTVTTFEVTQKANNSDTSEPASTVSDFALTPGAGPVSVVTPGVQIVNGGVLFATISGVSGSPSNSGETVKVYVHRDMVT